MTVPSTNVPIATIDQNFIVSSINVTGLSAIADLDVTVNITHPSVGDLDLFLQSPTGSFILLTGSVGGAGSNFTGTTFDDEATLAISAGQSPFTGSFQPVQPLSAFDGLDPTGTWSLFIQDLGTMNSGTLDSWSLTLTAGALVEPSTTTNANGDYSFTNLLPGTYSVALENPQNIYQTGTPDTFRQTVAVGANANRQGVDFAVVRAERPNALVGFNDNNGNFILSESNGSTLVNSAHGSFVRNTIDGSSVRFGDFNNDGIEDVVARNVNTDHWAVKLGTESGLSPEANFGFVDSATVNAGTITGLDVGDFNGDGLDDLFARNRGTGEFFVWLSNGNRFTAPVSLGASPAGRFVRHQRLGDINGDGRTDVVFQASNTGVFYTGRIANGGFVFRAATKWNASVRLEDVVLADFTNDGRDDLAFRVFRSGRIWVGESNGARFRLLQTALLEKNTNYDGVMVGDFNGDGIPQIVARNPSSGDILLLTPNAAGDNLDVGVAGILQGAVARFAVLDVDFDGKDDLLAQRGGTGDWFGWMSDGSTLMKNRRRLTTWSTTANFSTFDTIDSTNVIRPVGGGDPITPVGGGGSGSGGGLGSDLVIARVMDDLADKSLLGNLK